MSTMRATVLTNYVDVVRQLGLSPEKLLRTVGLSPQMLSTPDRLIPSDAVVRLLESAAEQSGCEVVGLRMSEPRGLSQFGVVGLLLNQQPTLRDALQMARKYRPLMNAAIALRLEELGDMAILSEEVLTEVPLPSRQTTELAMATSLRLFHAILGKDWHPRRVYFRHEPPKSLEAHHRVFRCPCEFRADFNALSFPRKDLDIPNPSADPQMARYAFDFIESVAGAATEPLAAEVRRSIYLLLPLGQATVKQVAESRGCSVRKLQLDLGRIGTSFAQLLDEARRERAQLYLGNPRFEIGQTAALLGYRHQSAFTRWFAGRFGMPPSEWQAKANAHGAPGPTLPDALRAQRDGC
ncbi:AraC family transcriptional regulator [Azoarcus sp. KH32C]|uniref:AraC family transcriptional regulator n=1 Tax=Azoarcus sp. KH32C TaxID=748247 RepID=UPI0002386A3B|nr:AraC family transcriptional regulator [Azoarcus sp. KH32C]BAL24291.1 transcriptional regulator, AraC family [Azoarcus sp. KH32C]